MNNLGINFQADLAGVTDDLPSSLTFSGETQEVTAGDETLVTDIDEHGTYQVYERETTLLSNAFNPMPAQKQTLTLDDVKYYVETTSEHPQAGSTTYTLRRKDGS